MDIEKKYIEVLSRIEKAEMDYRPTQQDKLKMYAWYKQINDGNVSGDKPGMTNFVSRAKYIAWERCQGMSRLEAMKAYVDFFEDKT
jgi:acyl-CoA-binding protein